MNQSEEAYAPFKYAPDEILNHMPLPLMKKALFGDRGADAKTSFSLVIIRYSATPLLSLIPKAQGQTGFFMGQNSAILRLMKIMLSPLKMESAPDEKILVTPLLFDEKMSICMS